MSRLIWPQRILWIFPKPCDQNTRQILLMACPLGGRWWKWQFTSVAPSHVENIRWHSQKSFQNSQGHPNQGKWGTVTARKSLRRWISWLWCAGISTRMFCKSAWNLSKAWHLFKTALILVNELQQLFKMLVMGEAGYRAYETFLNSLCKTFVDLQLFQE